MRVRPTLAALLIVAAIGASMLASRELARAQTPTATASPAATPTPMPLATAPAPPFQQPVGTPSGTATPAVPAVRPTFTPVPGAAVTALRPPGTGSGGLLAPATEVTSSPLAQTVLLLATSVAVAGAAIAIRHR